MTVARQGRRSLAAALRIALLALVTGCVAKSPPLPMASWPARSPLPVDASRGLRGFADFHSHMFSELSFGGFLFAGSAFAPGPEPHASATALAPCRHTKFPHLITTGVVAATGDTLHCSDGYPDFAVWPHASTHVHQQMYLDWVYRAYRHGLRLLAIAPTNNESLCQFVHDTASCDDMAVVDAQLRAIWDLDRYIGANEGGWLHVVQTPAEARQVIADNRLAVVIGAELDTLFGCRIGSGHNCTEDEMREKLDHYQSLGMRQINPIHLADGGFGGAAMYDERLSTSHYYLRKYYQLAVECGDGVEWQLRGGAGVTFPMQLMLLFHGFQWYHPPLPVLANPASGHCNGMGLTLLGRSLLREMMSRGLLIDGEHMSQAALDETLDIAEAAHYPVMLSHTWPRALKLQRAGLGSNPKVVDRHWVEQRAEMHRTEGTIARIRDLGGVVGVLTNQGYVHQDESGAVVNNCDTSSRSFAQALIYVARRMGNDGGVGVGTDMNGLPGQPTPRYGSEACGGEYADGPVQAYQAGLQDPCERVRYDGTMSVDDQVLRLNVAGGREFDFNTDGLAHYGLLPDLLADLKSVGVPGNVIDLVFHSAERYVEMWQRAVDRGHALAAAPPSQ